MKCPDVTVYTAIFNNYDYPRVPLIVNEDVSHVCFSDTPYDTDVWEVRVVPRTLTSARRENRLYKAMSHQFLPSTRYSIYIDGNIQLNADPLHLIAKYLVNWPIALFDHPWNDCLYDEGEACANSKVDDPDVIRRQLQRYEGEGYPHRSGLAAGTIIIRDHSEEVILFNTLWWEEISNGSKRDQVSLNYALWRASLSYDIIDPPWPGVGKNSEFLYTAHRGIATWQTPR